MSLPFSGAARLLGAADMQYVSTLLGCDLPAVQAVLTVETGGCGGFLSDGSGRPRILFEAHKFSAATDSRYETTPTRASPRRPGTASSTRAGLRNTSAWRRLSASIALRR